MLPRVLFTPADPSCKLTLCNRCKLIIFDDWSNFTIESFARRNFAPPELRDTADHDKTRLTVSNNFLKDGEISRGYKALQSSNDLISETEEVYPKMK
jgi:hypothetical protein